MARALSNFTAKAERPPANEPDAVFLEIIAAAVSNSKLAARNTSGGCAPDASSSPQQVAREGETK